MKTFTELPLDPSLMRAIADLKYETPTPIQAQALPILLGPPTDFIGLAATGTGKTAAFGIPLLERIDPSLRKLQGLVLCPTRELAMQVSGQINLMGKHMGIRSLPIYGGAEYGSQIRGLKEGINVVVGTPGRLVDHLTKGGLKLGDLRALILDEADEMISMGFKEDLEAILKAMPRAGSNIWLFSATMSHDVRKVADTYLRHPALVQVNKKEMLSTTVDQLYYSTNESNKLEVLCKLIDVAEDFYGLIFCQTKSMVTDLTSFLTERGYKVDCLHGDKDQKSRERTMQSYRDRRVSILICTDVASRGLDVKDVTHVINYSLPRELDSYVHRIGRTARSGKPGFAMSLVSPNHRYLISRIEKMTKSRIREGKIPTSKDVFKKKIKKILAQFNSQKTFARAIEMMEDTWKTEIAQMTKEEIIGRFLMMSFPALFEEAKQTKPAGFGRDKEAFPRVQQRNSHRRGFRHGAHSNTHKRKKTPPYFDRSGFN
ncbi:MAG: DEAD/DEAH box helicase [Deltaproteobacteria bacterium]|nr:DEAD/DEAH box helicase [Deltaproteobacteria bacterium]